MQYRMPYHLNSSLPSAAYLRQRTGSSLVQVMACRLFAAKTLPEPMLAYWQPESLEQISVKYKNEFQNAVCQICGNFVQEEIHSNLAKSRLVIAYLWFGKSFLHIAQSIIELMLWFPKLKKSVGMISHVLKEPSWNKFTFIMATGKRYM